MITASPSLTLHSSSSSTSSGVASCPVRSNSNGSLRHSASQSPRHTPRQAGPLPPPAPSFGRQSPVSPLALSSRRPLTSARSPVAPARSPPRQRVDAATQYSPPKPPSPSSTRHNKILSTEQEASNSSSPPPEPTLPPQMPTKRTSSPPPSRPQSTPPSTSPKRARPPRPASKSMPIRYETCEVKDLVVLISNMLMELVRFNDDIPLKDGRLTRFHSRAPPGISITDYLQRLTTHATLSPPILLSMVYYIDRLCALYPAFTISSLTVHRFLITAATVASKGLSDSFWTNNTYARVGGVSLKELALLELEFLWRVEWRIVPKPEVLVDYYRSLVERSEGYEIEVGDDGEKGDGDGDG